MTAIALALASAAAWGLSDFLGGMTSRGHPAALVLAVSQGIGLLVITPLTLIVSGAPPDSLNVGMGILGGVGGGLGVLSIYTALAIGPMSVVAPIFSLGVIVPAVVGVASGDRLGALQVAGMASAIIGCCLAGRSTSDGARVRRAGIVAALVAALGIGLGIVGLNGAAETGALWGVEVTRVTTFVCVAAIALVSGAARSVPDTRLIARLAGIGAIDLSANLFLAVATTKGLLSIVAVLSALYPAFTILMATLILRERLNRVQLSGLVAAFGGVAVLAATT